MTKPSSSRWHFLMNITPTHPPTQPGARLRRCICLLPLDNRFAGWRGAYPCRRHRRHPEQIARRTVFDSQKPNDIIPDRVGTAAGSYPPCSWFALTACSERAISFDTLTRCTIRGKGETSSNRVLSSRLGSCIKLLLNPRLVLAWLSGARAQTSYCEDGVISVHAGWRRDKSIVPRVGQMAVTSRERHKCSQRLSGAPVAGCMRRPADPGE